MALHFECQLAQIDMAFNSGKETKRFRNLLKQFKTKNLVSDERSLVEGKKHTKTLSMADAKRVYQFIKTYAEEHAVSLPGKIPGFKRDDMLLPPSSTPKSQVHRPLLASCEVASTRFMLSKTYGNRCSSDITWCFFSCLTDLISLQKYISPSGKLNADLSCSSFCCFGLILFFLPLFCFGLLCTILKPFTAFSEHSRAECRTLHLYLSIPRLRTGPCHSVNDPVMIWVMSLSFSHKSFIFIFCLFCFVF